MGPDNLVDPVGPDGPDPTSPGRVYRGGGVSTMSGEPGSGARGFATPDSRYSNLGFRVALPAE